MIRRLRTSAGVMGLAATVLTHGELLLASHCASAMDMSSQAADASALAGRDVSADMSMDMARGAEGMDMDGMPMPADDGREDDASLDACPLGPALGQGCLALASLPGSAPRTGCAPVDPTDRWSGDVARPDLLLTHALFRPPRA